MVVHPDLMALVAWVRPVLLHSTTGEHAMVGDEAVTTANARMVLGTSPFETKSTGMIYRT